MEINHSTYVKCKSYQHQYQFLASPFPLHSSPSRQSFTANYNRPVGVDSTQTFQLAVHGRSVTWHEVTSRRARPANIYLSQGRRIKTTQNDRAETANWNISTRCPSGPRGGDAGQPRDTKVQERESSSSSWSWIRCIVMDGPGATMKNGPLISLLSQDNMSLNLDKPLVYDGMFLTSCKARVWLRLSKYYRKTRKSCLSVIRILLNTSKETIK